MNTVLSVIIPAFNEQEMIHKTAQTISTLLESHSIPYELIFVDDGSKDQTWFQIVEATKAYDHINGIRFSRNFGKESAIFAGLSTAYQSRGPEEKGCCVVIDCDLQHPPEKIIDMYWLWQQGFQVVEGIKLDRGKENVLHTLAAKCFYCMISKATNIDMSHASDFKLLDDKAVQALLSMPERNAFFRALSSWIGFQTAQVEFEGPHGRKVQMVYPLAHKICHTQHHLFFHLSHADRLCTRRTDVIGLCGIGWYCSHSKVLGGCLRGIYDRYHHSIVHGQHCDDQPWHHRLLSC